ncbi:MAG: maleylacetoacetate isomerase, partial [Alphaproteobacteria bacterium]|nr:maleylacetoacetate isomerase [Alphaproteobacteria bacterium]
MLKLYGYFRSSAAYRIRIVLNLKGLAYEQSSIHLRRGEQFKPAYRALNPLARVPTLIDGERVLNQSL